jgi:endonuclease I
MKKSFLTLFALCVLAGNLCAQIPNGYYNDATGKTGDELKIALHEIIKGHTTIYYSQIWNAFWSTDNKGDGVVWDMYSDIPDGTPPYTFSMGQSQCGEYTQEGDCYNREHSWPQSWFSGDDQATPTRDLHHVFPTDGFVNSKRSNYPYGEVSTASWTSQNGSKLGTCKSSLGYNGTVFEPIDEYKGDFARALMYMSVRYYTEDDDWGTSSMTNKSEILPWAIAMLLDWSDADPVSQKEINRNNVIYSDYQHNRNPFIDHPEYARMIWDPNWHGGGSVGNGDYVKVTTEPTDWSGDYLIVYENSGKAFNGALSTLDANNNTISVTISNNQIGSSDETDAAIFTIAPMTGGYSIKSASGKYIGYSGNSNGLTTSNTALLNTISLSNGSIIIKGTGTSTLQYNSNADRFRYYGSTQNTIQLYKKEETYSITLATVEHGSITANAEEASEGSIITLTATPDEGYELDSWTVTKTDGDYVTVTNNQFEMPASNVTVSATFVYVGLPFEQKYYLVTSTDQLVAGRTYLIVNVSNSKALSKTQNTNNRSAESVSITNGNIIASIGTNVCELTLGGSTGAWTLYDANKNGYLYAAGGTGNNNYLKTQTNLTDEGRWTITFNNGDATIKTIVSTVARHTIMYNNTNTIFSCYASGQQSIQLFIRSEEFDHTTNETIANLFEFDKHTIESGVTLTVSGTTTCTEANRLIIEDGAQLVHHSDGIQATVKKTIEAYTADDNGWYTIATPFATYNPANVLTTNNYDLYAYDESTNSAEWRNYKAANFSLVAGQGYLYAHNPATTLRMTGTLNNGNHTETVDLSYSNSTENIRGFNLLGNPTAHDISFTKTESVSNGYYYVENGETLTYTPSATVPAGRGFFVKANAGGQSVTLNPQSKTHSADKDDYLCIGIGSEKVYIKLDVGISMPLFALNGHHASLYLTREKARYAMLVRNDDATIDLCFKPAHNGQQTLIAETQGLNLNYLHLIDNITGADIDLLQTPKYIFEAKTTDYAMRFQLVFASLYEDTEGDSEAFAYFNGSEWCIQNEGMATLQLVDMTGRILNEETVDRNAKVNTIDYRSGIYMLRLIGNDAVKTQKIVIR